MMRGGGFVEFEALRNLWLDGALRPKLEQLLAPAADAVHLARKMAQIDAEDTLVGVHECYRVELKPRCAGEHSEHAKEAPLLLCHRRRNAKHTQPAGGCEQAIAFFERFAADSIENEFDAAAVGDFTRPNLEILVAVVDQVIG